MSILGKLFKSAADFAIGKSYMGVINGNLPANTNWGNGDFLKANEISLYTNRALSKRAEKVSEVQFVVKNKKKEIIENHPILDLLNYPNEIYTGARFWELYQKYMDIFGAAYIIKESKRELFDGVKLDGLHLMRPDLVTPRFGTDGMVTHFDYSAGADTQKYEADQVIYIFNPDPKRPLQGVSLLKAGVTAIQTEVQIGAYHSRVIENGGKVEGVFKFKTPRITKEQLGQLKDQYNAEIADARKTGTPLFLGGDAEYSRLGLTPDELSFLEAKKATLRDIVIMTGVPKPLLGDFEDMQYSNADVAVRMFMSETIVPLLKALTGALDMALLPDGETLTFVDPTPENVEIKLKETESGLKNYYMTINEARNRHGLDALPDGDVVLVPFNLIPLGSQSVVEENPAGEKRFKGITEHPLRDFEVRKAYNQMQNKRIDSRAKPFEKKLDEYMNGQRDRLVAKLDISETRVYKKSNLLDDLVQLELEVKIGKEMFLPVIENLVEQAGTDAFELVASKFKFQMTSTITSWFTNRAETFMRQINETTFKKLAREFEASFEAGENRTELVKRVQTAYGDITEGRARTIARTEVHNATQFGTVEGYRQSGLNIKIWSSVIDTETRGQDPLDEADHISLDGEEKPIDIPFSNGLMYPGDRKGSAAEVINCRCVI